MHTRSSPPTGSLTTGGQSCSRSWHLPLGTSRCQRIRRCVLRHHGRDPNLSKEVPKGGQGRGPPDCALVRRSIGADLELAGLKDMLKGMRREIGVPPKRVRYGVRTQDLAQASPRRWQPRQVVVLPSAADVAGATDPEQLKYGVCRHGLDGDSEPELELWGSPVLTCKKGTSYTPCTSAAAR
jgi:hypothetical protein